MSQSVGGASFCFLNRYHPRHAYVRATRSVTNIKDHSGTHQSVTSARHSGAKRHGSIWSASCHADARASDDFPTTCPCVAILNAHSQAAIDEPKDGCSCSTQKGKGCRGESVGCLLFARALMPARWLKRMLVCVGAFETVNALAVCFRLAIHLLFASCNAAVAMLLCPNPLYS